MIKFWSFIYRTTGWMSPWAELACYKETYNRLDDLYESYKAEDGLADEDGGWHMGFEDYVGIDLGMWQAHHRFYRTSKQTWAYLASCDIWKRSHIWWR